MAEMLLSAPPADKTIIIQDEKKRFTYGEIKERIFRLSNALLDLGLRGGEKVSLMLFNSNEWLESFLAPIIAGGYAVPINWHARGDELKFLLSHSDSTTLIFGEEFYKRIEEIKPELKNIKNFIVVGDKTPSDMMSYEDFIDKSSPDNPKKSGASLNILMYTGGTTGKPKASDYGAGMFKGLASGIGGGNSKKERLDAIKYQTALFRAFDFQKTTNVHLVTAPLYHAAPFAFTFMTLVNGGTLVLMKKFDAINSLKLIESTKISTSYMPPILLKRILEIPSDERKKYDTSSLRSLNCGAAPCPTELKKRTVEYFGPIFYEWYASSDVAFQTVLRPEHYISDPSKFESVGKILPGNVIKIIDENGNECPPGVHGSLYLINPASRALQYYKDPEVTESSFRVINGERYFDEGEIMYRDEEDFLYVVDRKKDMIIIGGVNIYPAEIENVIQVHPKVKDVAVIGIPDPEWGESIKVFVQLKVGQSVNEDEIIDLCNEHLGGYKKPKSVEFVDSLPRHEDGKIIKHELKKILER